VSKEKMSDSDHSKSHDQFAEGYDNQVKDYNSYGHEVLFGLCYQYIKGSGSLLDLGIGTGLSSVHFAAAGLDVTGLDGSKGMLEECWKKGFAGELKQLNIQETPYPYDSNVFSFVLCCGVFHFFGELRPIFQEAFRLIENSGIFAFTVAAFPSSESVEDAADTPGFIKVPTAWGIPIFKHSDSLIYQLADSIGFTIEKEQKILSESGDESEPEMLFKAFVMQKR